MARITYPILAILFACASPLLAYTAGFAGARDERGAAAFLLIGSIIALQLFGACCVKRWYPR